MQDQGTPDAHADFHAEATRAEAMMDDMDRGDNDVSMVRTIPFMMLLRVATRVERCQLAAGSMAAMVQGAAWPIWALLFGRVLQNFAHVTDIQAAVQEILLMFLILGAVVGGAAAVNTWALTRLADNLTHRLRMQFFEAILRQELDWHDRQTPSSLINSLNGDMHVIHAALGEKLGAFLRMQSQALTGLIIAFVTGWRLALVVFSLTPIILGFAVTLIAKYTGQHQAQHKQCLMAANRIAFEAMSMIQTVMSFSTVALEKNKYVKALKLESVAMQKLDRARGWSMVVPHSLTFLIYAVAFGYGSKLIREGEINGGNVMTVLTATVISCVGLGASIPFAR